VNKKVTFGARPERAAAPTPDDWVNNRNEAPEEAREKGPMKRLTIDVSAELHTRIKVQCALKGMNIADEIRAILEQHFPGDAGRVETSKA